MRGLGCWIFRGGDATSGELSIRGCWVVASDLRTGCEAVTVDFAGIEICLPAGLPVVTANEPGIASALIVRCPRPQTGTTILTQTVLFPVLSQRLKRLNHNPQWRFGNLGDNCDAHSQDPRALEFGERDDGS